STAAPPHRPLSRRRSKRSKRILISRNSGWWFRDTRARVGVVSGPAYGVLRTPGPIQLLLHGHAHQHQHVELDRERNPDGGLRRAHIIEFEWRLAHFEGRRAGRIEQLRSE